MMKNRLPRRPLRLAFAACLGMAGVYGTGCGSTAPERRGVVPITPSETLVRLGTLDEPEHPERVVVEVPDSELTLELVRIPGGRYVDPEPAPGAPAEHEIQPFYLATTEIPWELFDLYFFELDEHPDRAAQGADAIARPSKPYVPPDRGFGHEGHPAIGITFNSAEHFCRWLAARTGRAFRLPTEAEFEHACRLAAAGADPSSIDLWSEENADFKPHAVATLKSDALGLHDLRGNVQEWAIASDGEPVTKGGSYRQPRAEITCQWREVYDRAWQRADPQIPKSRWWLSDGPFVGFRVVMDPPADPTNEPPTATTPAD